MSKLLEKVGFKRKGGAAAPTGGSQPLTGIDPYAAAQQAQAGARGERRRGGRGTGLGSARTGLAVNSVMSRTY
jgi:hypothetical protein